jgi:hypothetical protein
MSSDVLMMSDISGIGSPKVDDDVHLDVPRNGGKSSRMSLLPTATNSNGRSSDNSNKVQKASGSLIPRPGAAPRVPSKKESTADYIKRSLMELDRKSAKTTATPPPAVSSGTTAPPATAVTASAHARSFSAASVSASPPVSPIASVPTSIYSPVGVLTTEPGRPLEAMQRPVPVEDQPSTPPTGRRSYAPAALTTPEAQDRSATSDGGTPSLSVLLNNNYHNVAPATSNGSGSGNDSGNSSGNGAQRSSFSTPSGLKKGLLTFADPHPGVGGATVSAAKYEELRMHYQQLEASNQLLALQNGELEQQCSSHIENILELENVRDSLELQAERDQEQIETSANDIEFLKSQLQVCMATVFPTI